MSKVKRNMLMLIFSVTIMSVVGIAAINPALPRIADSLGIDASEAGLLTTVFALPGIMLTPILGILADRYGRKTVLTPALILFGITALILVFVRNFELMLALRFIQGCGAASLGALNVTLIGDNFEGDERAKFMGWNNTFLSLGAASFPLIGGGLATIEFSLPFAPGVIALPIAFYMWFFPEDRDKSDAISLKEYLRAILSLLKNPRIVRLFSIGFLSFVVVFGAFLTYLPFLVRQRFDLMPLKIGIVLSSMSIVQATVASRLGWLSGKFERFTMLQAAFVVYVISMIVFIYAGTIWLIFLATILFGMAQGVNAPNIQTLLAESVERRNRGFIMSFNRMISQAGMAFGPFLMGMVLSVSDVETVYWVGILFFVAAFVSLRIKFG